MTPPVSPPHVPATTEPIVTESELYEIAVNGFDSGDDCIEVQTLDNTPDLHDWRPLGGHDSLGAYWGCACAVHYGSDSDDAEWELPGANANANRIE